MSTSNFHMFRMKYPVSASRKVLNIIDRYHIMIIAGTRYRKRHLRVSLDELESEATGLSGLRQGVGNRETHGKAHLHSVLVYPTFWYGIN